MICNDPRSQIYRVPNLYLGRGHTMVMVQLSHSWWVAKGLAWRKDVLKQKHKRNSKGRPRLLRQAYDIETSSISRLLENSRNHSRSLVPSLGYQGESVCNFSRNRDIISILLVIHQERKGKSQTHIGMDSIKDHFQIPYRNGFCKGPFPKQKCVCMCICAYECALVCCACVCALVHLLEDGTLKESVWSLLTDAELSNEAGFVKYYRCGSRT